MVMTILLSDPRVISVPVHETYQPLVALGASFGPARARVRAAVAARLRVAQMALPVGMSLRVVEGHRSAATQASIIAYHCARVEAENPGISLAEQARLTSRFVAPVAVAPHVAGAAVDVTLVDLRGVELDLGTPIGAIPDESGGRCHFDARDITAAARDRRAILARALSDVGMVNYPARWWHWSYGDRYWALVTGTGTALYGPVRDLDGPPDGWAGPAEGPAGRTEDVTWGSLRRAA
jgi:D-alanyl-D-alanine dipeptidase